MRYELSKLKYNCWNDALDDFLDYKEMFEGTSWHDWYVLVVNNNNGSNKSKKPIPNIDNDDFFSFN